MQETNQQAIQQMYIQVNKNEEVQKIDMGKVV